MAFSMRHPATHDFWLNPAILPHLEHCSYSDWLGFQFSKFLNCNARTICTNSSGVKPDLGLDQDQQYKMNYKTN